MRARHVVWGLVAVAAVAVPAALLAGGGRAAYARFGQGGGMGPDDLGLPGLGAVGMLGRLADRLDLTDAQKQQIKTILEQERPAIQGLHESLRDARREFARTHDPAVFDEVAVRAFARSQAATMEEVAVQAARVRALVLSVLTPEQRSKAMELRQRWAGRGRAGAGDGS